MLKTVNVKYCYLCGNEGDILYEDLEDHLFGVGGKWEVKKCVNRDCGLLWLHHRPAMEDLGKAYENYYTHSENEGHRRSSLAIRLQDAVHRRLTKLFDCLTGMSKEKRARDWLYIEKESFGKLLDVGCGNGRFLKKMAGAGWRVEGTDFDSAASNYVSSNYGIMVHTGDLVSVSYPAESFDVVVLQHVVEHLIDPVSVLKECRRILRKGGKLILVTPNTESWGHKKYGRNWRGLEPPRHLFLFNSQNMRSTVEKSGFQNIETSTTPAGAWYILGKSEEIERMSQNLPSKKYSILSNWLLQYYELFLQKRSPEQGEELVVVAIK
ncbi:MAG: class I SAM-dependent methyltransferase [Blastocatellia bacterium]|nr:class I SAM-dependent methyltransferase [Blastocatellia bacterium]